MRDNRFFDCLGDGERDLEEVVDDHDFRARVASRPDIERALGGRATGSGAVATTEDESFISDLSASGELPGVAFRVSQLEALSTSSAHNVNRETEMAALCLARKDARRRISFPVEMFSLAAGSTSPGGNVISEKARLSAGDPGSFDAGRPGKLL